MTLVSCQRSEQNTDTFVTSPGSFEFFGGKLTVSVTQQTNGAVLYRIGHGSSISGPARPQPWAGRAWLIFPQTPTNAWIFDGRTNVTLIGFGDGGAKMTTRPAGSWASLPPALQRRLPGGPGK